MNYDLRIKNKIFNLPKSPGVYEFRDKQGKILYIGKATSLKDRVGSYFRSQSSTLGAPKVELLVSQIADIKIHETDSVLEALILESNLIKKHQPKYNVMAKDDKSFGYFVITRAPKHSLVRGKASEEFPRVVILRKTNLGTVSAKRIYGPYLSKRQMEIALKIIRKIFPFHSIKAKTEKGCLDFQIGRCPGPYADAISKKDYLKNIHGIEMILQGKKKGLLTELKKQMRTYSKNSEFEKAAEARNRIFALEHIRDVALISKDMAGDSISTREIESPLRIEAYDISNIGGDFAVGSMAVFKNNHPNKSQYRKFKIKNVSGVDDVAMMREMLRRRFQNDWPLPDIIFVDGGKGHLNMAENVVSEFGHNIPVVGVAKGPTRKKLDMYHGKEALIFQNIISDEKLVERIRNEAHRFAISYHKKLRRKNWKDK
ncbi:MAG: GIY-YIG nuclease family protein [Candidatus Moranbacteria bacterium]|nr:GIY-YIG nuclease family protein [Candidatus Moranbacteria bacterium]